MSSEVATGLGNSNEEDEKVSSMDEFLDDLSDEEIANVVEILGGLDPLDPKWDSEKRDLIMTARKVWQATGL